MKHKIKFLLKWLVFQLLIFNFLLSQEVSNQQIQELLKDSGISVPTSGIENQIQDIKIGEDVLPGSIENKIESDLLIKKEIDELQKNNISNNSDMKNLKEIQDSKDLENLKDEDDEKNEKDEEIISPVNLGSTNSQYFGYSTFQTNPDVFTETADLSASPDYVIGPGDEIIIMLWGQTEDLDTYTVTKDGYIFVKNIGQVFVNGLNLEKLEIKLKKIFKKSYSSISPDNNRSPTFFDISLGSTVLKPIRVFVMGEIDKPGAYEMKPSTTLFSSLYYFNGPKISGTLRDIHLIRDGKKVGSIDFYNFLLKGKKKNDEKLKDGDVIFIPKRNKTVHVSGEVSRPSIYELLDNENYNELKEFFGDYLVTTYLKRARLDRINSIEKRIESGKDRIVLDINLLEQEKNNKKIEIFDGDRFSFFKITDEYQDAVTINGPVKRPGMYSYEQSMTIFDLIQKSDGLSGGDIYRERIDLIRKLENTKESFFTFNLDSVLLKNKTHNIKLRPYDQIILYSLSDKIFSNNVSIGGFVKSPGIKQFREGMTVFDLIFLGGGLQNENHLSNLYFDRADLFRYNETDQKTNLISFDLSEVLSGGGIAQDLIKMGDKIIIYSKEQISGAPKKKVSIIGFVKSPGSYDYTENMDIRDLLFIASGYQDKDRAEKLLFGRADLMRIGKNIYDKKLIKLNLKEILNNGTNFPLKPGDALTIYSKDLFDKTKVTTISGMINKPATYEIIDNMSLRDLLLLAGGFKGDNKNYKIEISKFINSPDGTLSLPRTHIVKNIRSSFIEEKDPSLNTLIMDKDFVSVFAQGIEDHHTIEIEGEVVYPGTYVLPNRNAKLSDVVSRAGGLTDYANEVATFINRGGENISIRYDEITRKRKSKYDITLIDGDVLKFERTVNIVKVQGQVNSPGVFQYIEGFKAKDYIKLAGGFTKDAARSHSSIKHRSGFSEKLGYLANKKVYDGSEILVPAKEQVEKFSFTEYATNVTMIYTDLLQAVTMLALLGRTQ